MLHKNAEVFCFKNYFVIPWIRSHWVMERAYWQHKDFQYDKGVILGIYGIYIMEYMVYLFKLVTLSLK